VALGDYKITLDAYENQFPHTECTEREENRD